MSAINFSIGPTAIDERSSMLEYLKGRNLAVKAQFEQKVISAEVAQFWLAESAAMLDFLNRRRDLHALALEGGE